MTKISLQNRDIYVLLFLLPIARCLLFWSNALLNVNLWNFFSYFDFILALYTYFVILQRKLIIAFSSITLIVGIALGYNLILGTKINESLSYLYSLNNILICLLVFPGVDLRNVNITKLKKALIIFGIGFLLLYELSSYFAVQKITNSEYYGVERTYKEGFVLSHSACYYLIVLGYFLFLLKEYRLTIVFWVYALTLGARIGYAYVGVSIIMIMINTNVVIVESLYKLRYVVFALIAVILYSVIQITIQSVGLEGLMVITSGRSIFWMNAFNQMSSDWLGLINFFGRGPKYSFTFNEMTFGMKIWMHNDFVDILFNIGYIGLVVYLISFFIFWNRVPAMYLFFIFISSAVLNGFLYYDPLFVMVLSLVFAKKKLGY